MTYSLALSDKDLAIDGSRLGIVSGLNKLKQDLDLWLKEEFSTDRFHPRFGSTLERYIGGIIEEDTVFEIKAEVLRVLTNYQQLQLQRLQTRQQAFTTDELLDEIVSVRTSVSFDSVYVDIRFKTASNQTGRVTTFLAP
jgi:hypothetical protein